MLDVFVDNYVVPIGLFKLARNTKFIGNALELGGVAKLPQAAAKLFPFHPSLLISKAFWRVFFSQEILTAPKMLFASHPTEAWSLLKGSVQSLVSHPEWTASSLAFLAGEFEYQQKSFEEQSRNPDVVTIQVDPTETTAFNDLTGVPAKNLIKLANATLGDYDRTAQERENTLADRTNAINSKRSKSYYFFNPSKILTLSTERRLMREKTLDQWREADLASLRDRKEYLNSALTQIALVCSKSDPSVNPSRIKTVVRRQILSPAAGAGNKASPAS